jgi:hypothetical protein
MNNISKSKVIKRQHAEDRDGHNSHQGGKPSGRRMDDKGAYIKNAKEWLMRSNPYYTEGLSATTPKKGEQEGAPKAEGGRSEGDSEQIKN